MINPRAEQIPVLVEGFPDAELVKLLGISKKIIYNSGGKASIGKKMCENVYDFALAMVDEDPGKRSHSFYDNFYIVKDYSNFSMRIKKFKHFNIIELCPDLERWILFCTEKHHINISQRFKLPNDYKSLHSRISRTSVPINFKELIFYMLDAEIEEILFLQTHLLNRDINFNWK